MGLLIIGIIILAFGITCAVLSAKSYKHEYLFDLCSIFGIAVGAIMTVICATCWIRTAVHEDSERFKQTGYYLELKQEIAEIDKTSTVAKHQLNAEIREFNKEIRNNTYWHDNYWVGAYHYDFYSDFEPLEIIK